MSDARPHDASSPAPASSSQARPSTPPTVRPDASKDDVEEPKSSEPRTREEGPEEPRWITRPMLDAMHADLVRTYGGLQGVNADGLISLALARPRDRWATKEQRPDLADLAATYSYALAKNTGYRDCNLHVAFMAVYVFLGLNGQRLQAQPDAPIPDMMRGVASNGPENLAAWIRKNITER